MSWVAAAPLVWKVINKLLPDAAKASVITEKVGYNAVGGL